MGLRHPAVAAARKWAGQIKRTGLAKLWRKTGNLPGFHCSNDPLFQLSQTPQHHTEEQVTVTTLSFTPCWLSAMHTNRKTPCCYYKPIKFRHLPHAQLSYPPTHTLAPAAPDTFSDAFRTDEVCASLCLSL